jgi:hypothetical protein
MHLRLRTRVVLCLLIATARPAHADAPTKTLPDAVAVQSNVQKQRAYHSPCGVPVGV